MKFSRFLLAAFAMVATFSMVGCEESETEDDGAVYTITADRQTIEADGVDKVTFTVTDQNGVDITADKSMAKKIFLFEETTGTTYKGERTFSSYRNGTFTFYAKVKGATTQNKVTITAQNRKLYEKYQHKVCVFQCTGTWCVNCPSMTKALHGLCEGIFGDNIILLAAHGSQRTTKDPYAVAWGDNGDLGSEFLTRFSFPGYPYAVYDLAQGSGNRAEAQINPIIEKLLVETPATCGIKISKAEIDNEGNVKIEASIKSQNGGTYDLAYAVLVDNQPQKGGFEEVYNDVIAAVSENFFELSETSKVTLKADEECTKTWELKVNPVEGVEFKTSDYKVVVFAHNAETKIIDNANICAANSSVDYLLTK